MAPVFLVSSGTPPRASFIPGFNPGLFLFKRLLKKHEGDQRPDLIELAKQIRAEELKALEEYSKRAELILQAQYDVAQASIDSSEVVMPPMWLRDP